jgi:two-component system, LytTR family, response regulator
MDVRSLLVRFCCQGPAGRSCQSVLANLGQIAEIHPDVRSTYRLVMKNRERTVIDVSERQGRVLRTPILGL